MLKTTTLTVRLPQEAKQKLAELAARTRRTSSFLAAEAIAAYVGRELAAIEGIERGLAAVKAERVVPHEEVMRQAREVIRSARAKA
jgi:predicted transcriptional regulator